MKWKVTRNGEDSYKGDKGTEMLGALETAKLFNDMAARNGDKSKPYGIRPVEEKGK